MKTKACPTCGKAKPLSDFYERVVGGRAYPSSKCRACAIVYAKSHRGAKVENRVKSRAYDKLRRRKLRREVLAAYGGKCACCGESGDRFLVIDHVDGGGNAHRRLISNSKYCPSTTFHRWLRNNNYPKGFQVLCNNCNMAKALYGACPHNRSTDNAAPRSETYGPYIRRHTSDKRELPCGGFKTCSMCGLTKPLEHFQRERSRKDGRRNRCKECVATKTAEWRRAHPDCKYGDGRYTREWQKALRGRVLDAYGRVCACCGEGEARFLAIDHIKNDGAQHRAEIGGGSVYAWLAANNFPKENFQLLCHNCNMAKGVCGECPHGTS